MSDNTKLFTGLESESWTVTPILRWVVVKHPIWEHGAITGYDEEKVLQQMLQGSNGGQEWRDVEIANDF